MLEKVQSWHTAQILLKSRCCGGKWPQIREATPAHTDFTHMPGHGIAEVVCCRSFPQFGLLVPQKKDAQSRHLNFYEVLALLS